jgi:pentatricopeptide repeat protein
MFFMARGLDMQKIGEDESGQPLYGCLFPPAITGRVNVDVLKMCDSVMADMGALVDLVDNPCAKQKFQNIKNGDSGLVHFDDFEDITLGSIEGGVVNNDNIDIVTDWARELNFKLTMVVYYYRLMKALEGASFNEAKGIFDEMSQYEDVPVGIHFFTEWIKKCSNEEERRAVFQQCLKSVHGFDNRFFHIWISLSGDLDEVKYIFDQMCVTGVEPNRVTLLQITKLKLSKSQEKALMGFISKMITGYDLPPSSHWINLYGSLMR